LFSSSVYSASGTALNLKFGERKADGTVAYFSGLKGIGGDYIKRFIESVLEKQLLAGYCK